MAMMIIIVKLLGYLGTQKFSDLLNERLWHRDYHFGCTFTHKYGEA